MKKRNNFHTYITNIYNTNTKTKKSSSGASLFVRNLPYTVSQEQVKETFQDLGEIKSVTLKSGYAFVEFVSSDVAKQVIKKDTSKSSLY